MYENLMREGDSPRSYARVLEIAISLRQATRLQAVTIRILMGR